MFPRLKRFAKNHPYLTGTVVGGTLLAALVAPFVAIYVLPPLAASAVVGALVVAASVVASYAVSGLFAGMAKLFSSFFKSASNDQDANDQQKGLLSALNEEMEETQADLDLAKHAEVDVKEGLGQGDDLAKVAADLQNQARLKQSAEARIQMSRAVFNEAAQAAAAKNNNVVDTEIPTNVSPTH